MATVKHTAMPSTFLYINTSSGQQIQYIIGYKLRLYTEAGGSGHPDNEVCSDLVSSWLPGDVFMLLVECIRAASNILR